MPFPSSYHVHFSRQVGCLAGTEGQNNIFIWDNELLPSIQRKIQVWKAFLLKMWPCSIKVIPYCQWRCEPIPAFTHWGVFLALYTAVTSNEFFFYNFGSQHWITRVWAFYWQSQREARTLCCKGARQHPGRVCTGGQLSEALTWTRRLNMSAKCILPDLKIFVYVG